MKHRLDEVFFFFLVTDLPTPKPCQSRVFEEKKKAPKNLKIVTSNLKTSKCMCQIKQKRQIISVMVLIILSVVSVVLSCWSFGSDPGP